jgi:nucleotide-binding universal stress UspA family protein
MTATVDPSAQAQRAPAAGRPHRPVVVGVDETDAGKLAVDWAAAEARSRGVPLRIVHLWQWQKLDPWSGSLDRDLIADLQRAGHHIVEQARARALHGGKLEVSVEVREGYGPDVFVEMGREAGLIVLGTRHLQTIGRTALGSVSTATVSRASCPVVVVCGPSGLAAEHPSVIVGVSGEPHDEGVLAFAFEQAQRKQLPLRVVHCWDLPLADATLPPPEPARLRLSESVAGWRTEFPDVQTHLVVRRGHPVDVLLASARSQEMIVVGRRAVLHRYASMLGSVTLGVLHHATCPVAVVPQP